MRKLLSKIFQSGAEEVLNGVDRVLDTTITNEGEKLQAKEKLTEIVLSSLNKLQEMQKEIVMAETQGNWLQRSWRPIVMLTFTVIVVVGVFKPDLTYLADDSQFWGLLKLGLGGYVIGRTAEKVSGTVTKNVDIPFLRKKDRKDAMG
jgi:hypothetical protein